MEKYTEFLKRYLGKRRDISRNVYKIMNRGYRVVENGIATWEEYFKLIGVNI